MHDPADDLTQLIVAERWAPIDDVVMGGRSASDVLPSNDGTLVFTGRVSLERGGGFASIRCEPGRYDLSRFAGIVVRVRGDGKTYKLNVKTDAGFDSVQYQAVFATGADLWRDIRLPWNAFEPRFRGRPRPDAPPLDPGRIVTVGFLIADRQAGPFRLEIAAIRPLS